MKALISGLICLGLTGVAVAAAPGGSSATNIRHNPFARPAVLAVPSAKVVEEIEPVKPAAELELTATLVSDAMPLIIVDGELLGVGEEIGGYRLVAVKEGSAVFDKEGERHTVLLVDSGMEVE